MRRARADCASAGGTDADSRLQPIWPVRHSMSIIDGSYAIEPRGQDGALPRLRRQLEAVEAGDDGAKTLDAAQPMPLVNVLPDEQKAHEVGRR